MPLRAKIGSFQIKSEGNKASLRIIGSINWWKNSGEEFTAKIDELEKSGIADVEVYINSGGGSVFDANEIYNQLKRLKGKKSGRIGALCASAATIVSLACDTLVIARNGMYMLHEPRGSFPDATIDELETKVSLLKQLRSNFIKLYSKRTGLTEDTIAQMMAKETWFNAENAKAKGFVTDVGDPDEDVEATTQALESIESHSELPEVVAWFESIKGDQTSVSINSSNSMKRIIMHFGMPDASTEDEVLAKVKALEAKNQELQKQMQEENKRRATLRVDNAIKDKLITAEKRDKFIEKGTADPEFLDLALGNAKPVASASSSVTDTPEANQGNDDRSKWTFADWAKNDNKGLIEMREKQPERYTDLGKAYYGDHFKI